MMFITDVPNLALACAAGGLLGAAFFGGLWWTVRRGLASPRPALWFFLSLMARTALVLAGFLLVGGGRWQRLVACLVGFLIARTAVMRTTASRAGPTTVGAGHAPHA